MSANTQKNNFALVPKTPAAVEKAEPGTKRVLSGMVSDALALLKKQQPPKLRIVLLNDEADAIQLLERIICDWFKEATVLTFQSGEQALQELQRQDPDIFITDMVRPDDSMDGWKMIPLLAEQKVKYPVVVVSGCGGYRKNDYVAGKLFQDLLRHASRNLKITAVAMPFENEELLKVLEVCLHNRSAGSEKLGMDMTASAKEGVHQLKIVVLDENPFPPELMGVAIKQWFKNAVVQTFRDRDAGLRELSLIDPDLLIVEIVDRGEFDFKSLEDLAARKVTYPIVVTSGVEDPTPGFINSIHIENVYSSKGLKVTFLPKPFTVERFLEILERNLRIQRNPT